MNYFIIISNLNAPLNGYLRFPACFLPSYERLLNFRSAAGKPSFRALSLPEAIPVEEKKKAVKWIHYSNSFIY